VQFEVISKFNPLKKKKITHRSLISGKALFFKVPGLCPLFFLLTATLADDEHGQLVE
jgi:hypothetical protein